MKKLYYSFLSILMIVINSIAFADVVTYTDEESRNIIWGMNSHSHGISEFDSQKFFINICIFTIIGFIILGLINKIVKNKYLKKIVSIVGIILIFCFSTGKIETIYNYIQNYEREQKRRTSGLSVAPFNLEIWMNRKISKSDLLGMFRLNENAEIWYYDKFIQLKYKLYDVNDSVGKILTYREIKDFITNSKDNSYYYMSGTEFDEKGDLTEISIAVLDDHRRTRTDIEFKTHNKLYENAERIAKEKITSIAIVNYSIFAICCVAFFIIEHNDNKEKVA